MNNLSKEYQERLDKWRHNTTQVKSSEKVRGNTSTQPVSRRSGKNDYGDALTLEEWNEEAKRSQTRK